MDTIREIGRTFYILLITLILSVDLNGQVRQSKEYEPILGRIIDSFSNEMKKEENLVCIGTGGRAHDNIEKISVMFIHYKMVNIDEARNLEIKAIKKLLCMINKNTEIIPFVSEETV